MFTINNLPLPSTFISSFKEDAVIETYIKPKRIALRAFERPRDYTSKALSVKVILPLIPDYPYNYKASNQFYRLVSSLNLNEEQIIKSGRGNPESYIKIWYVDDKGEKLNKSCGPFIAENITINQIRPLLQTAEIYFKKDYKNKKVFFNYVAEFPDEFHNGRKVVISVGEGGSYGDVYYSSKGEYIEDLTVSIALGYAWDKTHESSSKNPILRFWHSRHPHPQEGYDPRGIGLEETVILLSKKEFFRQAK
jgi:hypothetical protein